MKYGALLCPDVPHTRLVLRPRCARQTAPLLYSVFLLFMYFYALCRSLLGIASVDLLGDITR